MLHCPSTEAVSLGSARCGNVQAGQGSPELASPPETEGPTTPQDQQGPPPPPAMRLIWD